MKISVLLLLGISASLAFMSVTYRGIDEDLLLIEQITGANFCSSNVVSNFDNVVKKLEQKNGNHPLKHLHQMGPKVSFREGVVKAFDNVNYSCLEFKNWDKDPYFSQYDKPKLSKNSGRLSVDNFKISLIATRSVEFSSNSDSDERIIFVRVPGGPGGTSIMSHFDDLINYEYNVATIDFFYRGNAFNLNYPNSSFKSATKGLKLFLLKLRERNKNAKIVLVGESFGATLSATVMAELSFDNDFVIDKAILLSPPFGNLKETIDNLEKLSPAKKIERYALYRLRSKSSKGDDFGQLQYLDWIDVFRTFHDPDDGTSELYDLLKLSKSVKVLIVYGNEDDRILTSKTIRFKSESLPNVDVFMVKGMHHEFNRYLEAADIKAEIDAFLDD